MVNPPQGSVGRVQVFLIGCAPVVGHGASPHHHVETKSAGAGPYVEAAAEQDLEVDEPLLVERHLVE